MAAIGKDKDGRKRILFVAPDDKRKTIYLGKCSMRDAESFKVRVESLLSALIQGREPNRDDAQWLNRLSPSFRKKLANVGLIVLPESERVPCIEKWVKDYIKERTDLKPRTIDLLTSVAESLVDFWGGDRLVTAVTEKDAGDFRLHLLANGLAESTTRSRCRKAKQFFNAAKKQRLIETNPFDDVPTADRVDKSRQKFVSRETIEQVIEACPNAQWRLIVALARYGGLRIPSELFGLTFGDILWDKKKFVVHSPKTEHIEGKASRTVPIFPELEPYLLEAYEQAEQGQSRLITIYNEKNSNLRTQFHRIIKRAGLVPWPKPFQNLRSSRETELVGDFPIHVVTAWLGNSPEVARKHYLQVTDDHFDRAVNAAQNPTQQLHETARNDSQREFIEMLKRSVSPEIFKALRTIAKSCDNAKNNLAPRVGLEPTT